MLFSLQVVEVVIKCLTGMDTKLPVDQSRQDMSPYV